MTTDAKRNQVVHHIATEPAPGFYVMDLQAFHRAALLTPPAISFEQTCPDDCVFFRIQNYGINVYGPMVGVDIRLSKPKR